MSGAQALAGVPVTRAGPAAEPDGKPGGGAVALAVAIGVDIVDVERLRAMVGRRGEVVLRRLLTDDELAAVTGTRGLVWTSVAGRVAAKEATKKLLGSRGELARWTEVEVRTGAHGEPHLWLSGQTRLAAARCGFTRLQLSLAYEKTTAIAVVLGW